LACPGLAGNEKGEFKNIKFEAVTAFESKKFVGLDLMVVQQCSAGAALVLQVKIPLFEFDDGMQAGNGVLGEPLSFEK
jgi:hypothetical protein